MLKHSRINRRLLLLILLAWSGTKSSDADPLPSSDHISIVTSGSIILRGGDAPGQPYAPIGSGNSIQVEARLTMPILQSGAQFPISPPMVPSPLPSVMPTISPTLPPPPASLSVQALPAPLPNSSPFPSGHFLGMPLSTIAPTDTIRVRIDVRQRSLETNSRQRSYSLKELRQRQVLVNTCE